MRLYLEQFQSNIYFVKVVFWIMINMQIDLYKSALIYCVLNSIDKFLHYKYIFQFIIYSLSCTDSSASIVWFSKLTWSLDVSGRFFLIFQMFVVINSKHKFLELIFLLKLLIKIYYVIEHTITWYSWKPYQQRFDVFCPS